MIQVLSLILPVLISGIVLIITIKLKACSFLNIPIDFNLNVKSKNIFGSNKTFKGLAIFILFSIISCYFLNYLYKNTNTNMIHELFAEDPLGLGLLFGISYEIGELVNSFIKRRIGIKPGKTRNKIQYFFDLSDGVITTAFALLMLNKISFNEAGLALILGIFTHLLTDQIMIKLNLKKIFQ